MATKMASSSENDYDTDKEKQGKVQAVKKKKKFEQKFLDTWLTSPVFKPWLKKKTVEGKHVPFCEVCSVKLSYAKTSLIRHSETKTHSDNAKRSASLAKSQPSISGYMGPSMDAAAKMEIKICSFIAENDMPISMCENFLPFLRDLFPADEVLKKVTLGKQKATNIIRQVLGFHFLRENIEKLQQHRFSVVIDETTDKSTTSQLAILGTFFDANSFEMKCVFVDLIELPNGKADTIYGKIKACMTSCNIPMINVIGFCADTCNVMFGKHHSVSQLFIKDCPWILPVKCSCHLIHLCSSYASQKLPKSLEDLCRNIYSHFHMSSQRIEAFREFQDFFQVKNTKF
ncbi:uncharacterized protein LOC135198424 [Macrobrachium nipponense]|uniref:uncharacterized protein LOC135198424 n=1 Tax=Macrobrachium nipponense TaxID=159736 RepID=UPI0030C7C546